MRRTLARIALPLLVALPMSFPGGALPGRVFSLSALAADAVFPRAKPEIPIQEYRLIRNLVLKLLRDYPPGEYSYVGVGASPTPVIAFLQAAGIEAQSVPFSRDRTFKTAMADPGAEEALRKSLHRHLRQFLPDLKNSGRRLLVMDYASSGLSLSTFKLAMDDLKREFPGTPEVKYLGFFERLSDHTLLPGAASQLAPDKIMMEHFENKYFDSVREFPGWLPTQATGNETFHRSSAYEAFLQSLRGHISRDEKLAPLLQRFKAGEFRKMSLAARCMAGFRAVFPR